MASEPDGWARAAEETKCCFQLFLLQEMTQIRRAKFSGVRLVVALTQGVRLRPKLPGDAAATPASTVHHCDGLV